MSMPRSMCPSNGISIGRDPAGAAGSGPLASLATVTILRAVGNCCVVIVGSAAWLT
jgi:hypothetical protein